MVFLDPTSVAGNAVFRKVYDLIVNRQTPARAGFVFLSSFSKTKTFRFDAAEEKDAPTKSQVSTQPSVAFARAYSYVLKENGAVEALEWAQSIPRAKNKTLTYKTIQKSFTQLFSSDAWVTRIRNVLSTQCETHWFLL